MSVNWEMHKGILCDKLEKLFDRKGFVKINPGNVILPIKYIDDAENILKSKVREDDVWLISFPRTGSTWTVEMIWLLANNLNYDTTKQLQLLRFPLIELSALFDEHHRDWLTNTIGNSVEMINNLPSPRFLKSHLPYYLLPEQMDQVKPKIIYVARNPKDVCVSNYHYHALVHELVGPFEEFCELFLADSIPYGSFWTHVKYFWERRHEPNILFLKYEDMKKDLPSTIYKCAKFLGVEKILSPDEMEKLCDHLNFDKMQKNKAVNLEVITKPNPNDDEKTPLKFIRRGQIGDWKNFMSADMSKKFDEWIEQNTGESDLKFEYE